MAENFYDKKIFSTPKSLSMKVTVACGFFLCIVMQLKQILIKFHCLKFKNFFLTGFLRDGTEF
jgi:hypothetical protein